MRTLRTVAWWTGWLLLLAASRLQATETVTLYVTNAQGTVVAEMTPQGQVTYEAAYRPYGQQATGVPQAGPGYTGHVNDPDSGLVYMQARYYDPDITRFLSVDPVGPNVGNGFNFNRYAYADNRPSVNIDPTGMCSQPGVPDPVCPPPPQPPQSPQPTTAPSSPSPSNTPATLPTVTVTATNHETGLPPPFVLPPPVIRPGIKEIKPPIVKLPPSRPVIKKIDDWLSRQLVKKFTKRFGKINKFDKFSPNPYGAFVTLMLYPEPTGGCDAQGHCADEVNWNSEPGQNQDLN